VLNGPLEIRRAFLLGKPNMIKLNGNKRTVRETEADWTYQDGDELKTEPIKVRYFSPTVADVRRQTDARRKAITEGKDWYVSHQLVEMLDSLPDLIDPKTNKPVKITLDFLELQELMNLQSIVDAIDADVRPKSQPAK
jgi:hypothetical protein